MLRDVHLLDAVLARAGSPRACFLSDDVAISFYLKRMKGFHLRKLVRMRIQNMLDDPSYPINPMMSTDLL